ncbi:MAG: hypothetical protein ACLPTJ_08320 [Solirubrobacteraceae bacterium]
MTERHGISAEEAFARLRRQASNSNAGRSLARSARSLRLRAAAEANSTLNQVAAAVTVSYPLFRSSRSPPDAAARDV